MVLLAYDGSADARAAIAHGGSLLGDQPAVVVTVWRPFALTLVRTPTGIGPMVGLGDIESIDAVSRREAEEMAQEGAGLARAAGLAADGHAVRQTTSVAHALLAEADRTSSSAIVMGSRGRTGLRSLVLGSVSHAVVQHADRPVVVVPSPDVARSRLEALRAVEPPEELGAS